MAILKEFDFSRDALRGRDCRDLPHPIVDEVDVLIGAVRWLAKRGISVRTVSIAKGSRSGIAKDRQRLETELKGLLTTCSHCAHGPDIIAASKGEYWQVECKGAGSGKLQTQRNNFDRALASVVSYYRDLSELQLDTKGAVTPVLALALPATSFYLKELRRRVRRSLRQKLNLWVLLFEQSSARMKSIEPRSDYP